MGIGLGTIAGIGGTVGGMVGGVIKDSVDSINQTPKTICSKCGEQLPLSAKFCMKCGAKVDSPVSNDVVCPSCGKITPKGKFCSECGASLVKNCPKCSTLIQPGSKFCPECGEKIN